MWDGVDKMITDNHDTEDGPGSPDLLVVENHIDIDHLISSLLLTNRELTSSQSKHVIL